MNRQENTKTVMMFFSSQLLYDLEKPWLKNKDANYKSWRMKIKIVKDYVNVVHLGDCSMLLNRNLALGAVAAKASKDFKPASLRPMHMTLVCLQIFHCKWDGDCHCLIKQSWIQGLDYQQAERVLLNILRFRQMTLPSVAPGDWRGYSKPTMCCL